MIVPTTQQALEGYLRELLSEDSAEEELSNRLPSQNIKVATERKVNVVTDVAKTTSETKPVVTENVAKDIPLQCVRANARLEPVEAKGSTSQEYAASRMQLKPKKHRQEEKQTEKQTELSVLEAVKKEQLQKMLAEQLVTQDKNGDSHKQQKTENEAHEVSFDGSPQTELKVRDKNEAGSVSTSDTLISTDAIDGDGVIAEWGETGRPQWAENTFEALLFDVAGLSLAVPLVTLGQIVQFNEKLTVLQGQSEWFMGILPTPIGDIRTINTALFVMPERYKDSFLDTAKYVVTINDMPWGLAVDSVNQPVKLHPDDVKWRTQVSAKRPWLAGTVKSHMCTLIDIPRMAQMLENSDKNRK